MPILQDILYKVSIRAVHGILSTVVNDLQVDSRKITKGSMFIAIKGTHADGHQFIEPVVEKGAAVVVCETLPPNLKDDVTYIEVENSAMAAGFIAHNFYGQPSEKLQLIGVTGTNGKTTIATVLYKLFTVLDYKCGLISTVQNQIGDTVIYQLRTQHQTQNQPECIAETNGG